MNSNNAGITEMTRKARYFASQQRLIEKIDALLDANGRVFAVVSGTENKPSRLPKSKGPKDTRKWQRQFPLAGSGAILIQERGYRATKVKVILKADNKADQMVFLSHDGEHIDLFHMGLWVWALQDDYDAQVYRDFNPEIIAYEQTFLPLWDWPGVNDPQTTVDPFHKFMLDHPPPE